MGTSRRAIAKVLAAILALGILYVILWRPLVPVGEPLEDGYTHLSGIVHVHTTLSDGSGTPEEVIRAAQSVGLGFLVITDHNNVDAKRFEGYHGRLLVLVGSEISTNAGHVLALGITDPSFRFSGDAADALEDIRDLGGWAVAAHPLSPRGDLSWTGWDLPGPWGLEVLSDDTEWRTAGAARLCLSALLYKLNARYALLRYLTAPRLERWDALLAERATPGLAGADAHGRIAWRDLSLKLPTYASLFSLVQNHILLPHALSGDIGADARTVVETLEAGHSYVGLDALAPADGFAFVAERAGSRRTMGETLPVGGEITFRAGGRLPRGARIKLLRGGAAIAEETGSLVHRTAEPGIYRVEVHVPGWEPPFILSNSIAVLSSSDQEARETRAAWPRPSDVPSATRLLGLSGFLPEHDPTSVMAAAPEASDEKALSFRLGRMTPEQPHTWCALVNREARDLSGTHGLVFRVRADGVYRFWVQARDLNPASSDQGLEWWFASVKTSTAWKSIAVPFARFRTINPHTDGRLDLDKVRELVFLVDPSCMKPGVPGTIWISGLGAY